MDLFDDHIKRLLAIAAVAATFALAPAAGAAPAKPAAEAWMMGSNTPEPKARVPELLQRCYGGGTDVSVTRDGDRVEMTITAIQGHGGAVPRFSVDDHQHLSGTIQGESLVLTGEHVTAIRSYAFDENGAQNRTTREAVRCELQRNALGHWVGTCKQGANQPSKVWFAPAVPPKNPPPCGPPPP